MDTKSDIRMHRRLTRQRMEFPRLGWPVVLQSGFTHKHRKANRECMRWHDECAVIASRLIENHATLVSLAEVTCEHDSALLEHTRSVLAKVARAYDTVGRDDPNKTRYASSIAGLKQVRGVDQRSMYLLKRLADRLDDSGLDQRLVDALHIQRKSLKERRHALKQCLAHARIIREEVGKESTILRPIN